MNTVEWTIAEMLNHQEILEKATKELNIIVGKDRLIQESDIPQLNYIKACCKESFRLHPPNAFLPPHGAREDTTLAGYFVPKGQNFIFIIYAKAPILIKCQDTHTISSLSNRIAVCRQKIKIKK